MAHVHENLTCMTYIHYNYNQESKLRSRIKNAAGFFQMLNLKQAF